MRKLLIVALIIAALSGSALAQLTVASGIVSGTGTSQVISVSPTGTALPFYYTLSWNTVSAPVGTCSIAVDSSVTGTPIAGAGVPLQNCASTGSATSGSVVVSNLIAVHWSLSGAGSIFYTVTESLTPPASGSGTITAVNAGTGITGGGVSGSVNVAIATSYRLPQSCSNGQVATWDSTTSAWDICSSATGTITGVTAGTGLSGGGSSGSVTLTLNATPTTCTSQVLTAISSAAVGTCTTLTSSYLPLSAMGTITGGTWQGSVIGSTYGGTGVNNTATLTLGTANVNLATLGSGLVYNTTTTGALSDATAAQVVGVIGATAVTNATNATNVATTGGSASGATFYPGFVGSNTSGNQGIVTTAALNFVPSTGVLSATSFSGAGSGLTGTASSLSIGGNATTATTATNATNVATTGGSGSSSTFYPTFVSSNTSGNYGITTTGTLSFVPSTGALSAMSFSGAGTGLTGTASGLSIGGNAATATGINGNGTANQVWGMNSAGSAQGWQNQSGLALGTSTQIPIMNSGATAYVPQTISQDATLSNAGAFTVKGVNAVPLCTGFTPTNGQALEYTTALSPNPCYTAATVGGSLPSGTLGQPAINTNGSTGYATSALFEDVSQESGVNVGAQLNACNARMITNGGGRCDASALGWSGGTEGTAQTISSQVDIGELLAPTCAASGTGGSLAAGNYRISFTLTSPKAAETSASEECMVTGLTSGQNIVVTSPTYYGNATAWAVYATAAGGAAWSEDLCGSVGGTTIGTNITISAACSGKAISKSNQGFGVSLVPPHTGLWAASITNGSAVIRFFNQSSYLGNEAGGEGRPFAITAASTSTDVECFICTDENPKEASYYFINSAAATDLNYLNSETGTVTTAAVLIANAADTSRFNYLHGGTHEAGIPAIYGYGLCCGTIIDTPQAEAGGIGIPFQLGNSGSSEGTVSVDVHDLSAVHPGMSYNNIVLTQAVQDVHFSGVTYVECSNSSTTADIVGIGTTGNVLGPIVFDDLHDGSSGSNCSGTTTYMFGTQHTTSDIQVGAYQTGHWTNVFHDTGGNGYASIAGVGTSTTGPGFRYDVNQPLALSNLRVSGVATSASTSPICPNGTNGAFTTSGCSSGSNTINNANQYSEPYYANSGSANYISGLAPPTVNGLWESFWNVNGSAAVQKTISLPGIPVDATNPATLLYSDRGSFLNWTSGTALALPAVTTCDTSHNLGCNLPFVLKNTEGATLTITPNAGAGDLINGASSLALLNNWSAFVYQDSTNAPGHWFANRYPDFTAFGSTCTNGLTWSTTTGIGCQASAPGTVTSITVSSPLTGGTITGTGTIGLGTLSAGSNGLGNLATIATGTLTNGDYCTYSSTGPTISCNSTGGGGDTITSPNSTLAIGGTSSATTLDLTGAAGEIMAGATPALTHTPTLGVSGTAGTLSLFPATGNFTTTLGSAATASNTFLFPAAVFSNGHLGYCVTSSTTCTWTDAGYSYNAIPSTDVSGLGALASASYPSAGIVYSSGSAFSDATAAEVGTVLNIAQYDTIYSNGTSAAPLGAAINGFQYDSTSGAPAAATAAQAATLIQGLTGCNTANYVFTPQASDCVAPSATTLWSSIENAAANLTLSNAAYTSTFDQTSNVAWLWANTTAGTGSTTNASPLLELAANYYTGSASAADTWSVGSSLAAGSNGASTLAISHSGSTGAATVSVPGISSTGSGGGFQYFTQGAAPSSPAGFGFSTTLCIYAPSSVVSMGEAVQSAGAAQGIKIASFQPGSTTAIQDGISGDSNHAIPGGITGKTGAITGTNVLCAATAGTNCGQTGQYWILVNMWESGTACSSVGSAAVSLNITYTDEAGTTHSNVVIPLLTNVSGTALATSFIPTVSALTAWANAQFLISTNGTAIYYNTTYTGCSTGTFTYNFRPTVVPTQ